MNRTIQASIALVLTGMSGPTFAQDAAVAETEQPKLILQITFDQMRGDFPMRYKDRLGEGGFRYLMEKGTHYINAHFQHADTETPIGHAALFTGTNPAHAGNWFDVDNHRGPPADQTPVGFSGHTLGRVVAW